MTFRVVLVLSALCAFSVPAFADGQKGSFEAWGFQGLATQSLKDWNDRNAFFNTGLEFFGVEDRFHEIGGALPYGAEVNYRVGSKFSVGVAMSRQRGVADNEVFESVGFATGTPAVFYDRVEASLTQAVVVISQEVWGAPGMFVWLNFGYGMGEVELAGSVTPVGAPPQPVQAVTFDGNSMVGGMALGLRRELGGRAMVRASLGFQMADLGEMSSEFGPPRNFITGEALSTDFSGFSVNVGVGMVLTKVR